MPVWIIHGNGKDNQEKRVKLSYVENATTPNLGCKFSATQTDQNDSKIPNTMPNIDVDSRLSMVNRKWTVTV